ncbi:Cytidylate kinase [hydrothermal vent metagenome]|uniref:(d)CMP kinase n=1 Tax=hydrothermal vent metagenome TaxID=652676 RepID=A0A3B0TVL5_9ZZZZ
MPDKIIIAIDGYSSCGKSTVAKSLARKLGYAYIDSGAMYRSVTLFALRNNWIVDGKPDREKIINGLGQISITFRFNKETGENTTFLNGENVEEQIRGLDVSNNVSPVSAIKEVRQAMVKLQRQIGEKKGIVMDGRDIGTVVFPYAELKIFMTASPEIRAQRRYDELVAKGKQVSMEEIIANINERDYIDQNRKESPLRQAEDAVVLDNSNFTLEGQLEWALKLALEIINRKNEGRN